ncbi:branched-chain amino acid ABC transporter substrate-binding protein [Paraburkholderia caribensis]|nr:branched-chain amino acid ABC transporter substrate-binding protein [Paraburkholderia caribensis]
MKRQLHSFFFGLAVSVSLLQSTTVVAEDRPASSQTIYVVAPFSGNLKGFGVQIQNGVDAALADWNTHQPAGINQIRAEYLDDSCDPEKAKAIAAQLVAVHAKVVLGHVCSVASLPASEIYAHANIPMLSAASSNAAFTERGLQSVFRVTGRDDSQAPLVAETIVERFPGKRVVIVEETDITGRSHGEHVRSELLKRGVAPVAILDISSPTDIPDLVTKLRDDRAQVVFYGGHQAASLGALLTQARGTGFSGQFISNDGAGNKLVAETAHDAADGLLFTFDRNYAQASSAQNAVARLKMQGNSTEGFTLNAYAAAQILSQALTSQPNSTGSELARYIHSTRFDTAIGKIGFNAKGDLDTPQEALFQWQNGTAVPN